MASSGEKLMPTLKKDGIFKGSGTYIAKQTGIQAMKKVVPAYLMLVALSAATPNLGSQIASSKMKSEASVIMSLTQLLILLSGERIQPVELLAELERQQAE